MNRIEDRSSHFGTKEHHENKRSGSQHSSTVDLDQYSHQDRWNARKGTQSTVGQDPQRLPKSQIVVQEEGYQPTLDMSKILGKLYKNHLEDP